MKRAPISGPSLARIKSRLEYVVAIFIVADIVKTIFAYVAEFVPSALVSRVDETLAWFVSTVQVPRFSGIDLLLVVGTLISVSALLAINIDLRRSNRKYKACEDLVALMTARAATADARSFKIALTKSGDVQAELRRFSHEASIEIRDTIDDAKKLFDLITGDRCAVSLNTFSVMDKRMQYRIVGRDRESMMSKHHRDERCFDVSGNYVISQLFGEDKSYVIALGKQLQNSRPDWDLMYKAAAAFPINDGAHLGKTVMGALMITNMQARLDTAMSIHY